MEYRWESAEDKYDAENAYGVLFRYGYHGVVSAVGETEHDPGRYSADDTSKETMDVHWLPLWTVSVLNRGTMVVTCEWNLPSSSNVGISTLKL